MRRLAIALLATVACSVAWAGGSRSGDGVNDGIGLPAVDLTGTEVATVAFWYYTEANYDGAMIESSGDWDTVSGGLIVYAVPNSTNCGGKILFALHDAGRRRECVFWPSPDTWHHIAAVFDNSTTAGDITVYVDGVEETTDLFTDAKTVAGDLGNYAWNLFARDESSLEFEGSMRDFRIYDRALSVEEVSWVMAGRRLGDEVRHVPLDRSGTTVPEIAAGSDGSCTNCPSESFDGPPSRDFLLFDGFDEGIADWTMVYNCTTSSPPSYVHNAGHLQGRQGMLRQTTNCFGGTSPYDPDERDGHFAYYDDTGAESWTDYEFSAWVYNSDDDGVGLAWRWTDIDNHYRVDCDDQRNFCAMVKADGGTLTTIANDSVSGQCNGTYFDDGWHLWKVTTDGSDHTVSIDGVDCFGTVSDSTHTDGTVAAYGWGSASTYYGHAFVRAID